jgi:hypothetical protein
VIISLFKMTFPCSRIRNFVRVGLDQTNITCLLNELYKSGRVIHLFKWVVLGLGGLQV